MARTFAKVFGVLLVLAGIVGAFSNAFIGLGGYFMANAGLVIVNIVLGVILLLVSSTEAGAGAWLKIIGVVYAALAIIGFAVMTAAGTANVLGFMAFNAADTWLYLIGGALMVITGFMEDASVRTVHVRTLHQRDHRHV